jgi:hypothetical protein
VIKPASWFVKKPPVQLLNVPVTFRDQLPGPIPVELLQLGKLKYLGLQANQLSGQEALHLHLQEHNPACYFEC